MYALRHYNALYNMKHFNHIIDFEICLRLSLNSVKLLVVYNT